MGNKVLTAAVNVFCAAAILFSLLAAWTVLSTPKGHAPALLGHSMLTVLTGSMAPALPEGSLIFVRQTDPSDIQAGDIITFYTTIAGFEGVINTHRVVEVTTQDGAPAFRTQGDANPLPDEALVTGENLVGRLVARSLALGVVVSFLHRPYIFLPLVLVPLLVLILRSALRLGRLAKEEIGRAEQEIREEQNDDKD